MGTHIGQAPDLIPPTGKRVVMTSCLVTHWENGKIVEGRDYLDTLGFMQQLGFRLVPPQMENEE